MKRTQFKGRTLVLKVKFHTYEVYTRQVVPPKAVSLAEDLYKYSLPMLTKLEEDFPAMKLRLMGLRCTHLVSTKKPDALTFFGFRKHGVTETVHVADGVNDASMKRKASAFDAHEWQTWSEKEFEDAAAQEHKDELDEVERLSQLDQSGDENEQSSKGYRGHGKDILPNPRKGSALEEELWDCPICHRPQGAVEKDFNDHIDLCLSRSTIREAVQETSGNILSSRSATPEPKRVRMGDRKKDSTGTDDPRQRRLFFG
jgi:DNA polymerase kappa